MSIEHMDPECLVLSKKLDDRWQVGLIMSIGSRFLQQKRFQDTPYLGFMASKKHNNCSLSTSLMFSLRHINLKP